MSDSLIPIKFPNLTEAEFGNSLAQQFANINTNFQKLANFGLYSGADGKSCSYITYNLNAVFFYPTSGMGDVTDVDDAAYSGDFLAQAEAARPALMKSLRQQVDNDYLEYYRLTKGTKRDYAQMCAFLLWGSKFTFMPVNTPVSCESMMGVLAHDYEGLLGDIKTIRNDREVIYKALWLKDWFEAGYKEDAKADKLQIFLDHMDEFDPGKIIVAVSPTNKPQKYVAGDYEPVGSLAYVYIDPRFRNERMSAIQQNTSQNMQDMWAAAEDISCVLYWTTYKNGNEIVGTFKSINAFPQIWSDGTGFFWKINNKKTNIPVTGTQGLPGKNSQFVVIQRVENLSHIDKNSLSGARIWAPLGGTQYVVRTADSGRPSRMRNIHSEMASLFEYDLSASIRDTLKAQPITDNTIQKYQFTTGPAITLGDRLINTGGWLYDTTGFNETQLNQLYRVYRIVGRESFWKVVNIDTGAEIGSGDAYYDEAFRPDDPSYEQANYIQKGQPYKVVVNSDPEIQNLILSLDGAPCIIVPGPAYNLDRTDSTVWFGTLKAIRAYAEPSKDLMLVVYCGDENQMTTDLDEHTQAGNMQELDVYTSKKTGDNRNKPRGQMLPIGSAHLSAYTTGTVQRDPGDVFGSHFIHSDLGGFTSRKAEVYIDYRGVSRTRYYGIQPQAPTGKVLSSTGDSILYNNLPQLGTTEFPKDGQFVNIPYKRIMHVGSVNDYRTLNFVPVGGEGTDGTGADKVPNGAVPGRKGVHTNVQDYAPYGTPDFWGLDVPLYEGVDWFAGSETHIDEPLTITRYRDLHKRKHLLTVEGDTVIGPHVHANMPGIRHFKQDGGLIVQSTLSVEVGENAAIWDNSVFKNMVGGIDMRFMPFLRGPVIKQPVMMNGEASDSNWISCLARSNKADARFEKNYLGMWVYGQNGTTYDAMYGSQPTWQNSHRAYPSILAEDLIGGRIIAALDGIAVIDQNNLTGSPTETRTGVPFSVDRDGNMQTHGSEVRSNNRDTLWAFHTAWKPYNENYAEPMGDVVAMHYLISPSHNQTIFGTSHYFQKLFGSNKVNDARPIIPWQLARRSDYLRAWAVNGAGDVAFDSEGNHIYTSTTWRTLDQEPVGLLTNLGYIHGQDYNGDPIYKVAWDMTTGQTTNLGGQISGAIPKTSSIIPAILKFWSDLLYQKGSLTVQGVACSPVWLHYAGDKRMDGSYSGRFGINAQFGMVIGSEGGRLGSLSNHRGNPLLIMNQLRNDLGNPMGEYNYQTNSYLTNIQNHFSESTFGDIGDNTAWWDTARTDPNMFYNDLGARLHPGLWVMSGALIDESVFIGRDLVVDRLAAIKGQIRAKSFRRFVNSEYSTEPEPDGSAWAFMLDNGMSSTSAPHHKSTTGTFFDQNKQSPIIFDLGAAYGPSRLIRFGVARNAKLLSADGKELTLDLDYKDRDAILFGAQPGGSYEYYNKTGYLFGTNTNKITVNAQSNNLWASISICIALDKQFTSRDRNKKGPFGGGRYSSCWGIGTPEYPGGGNDNPDNSVELICTGFDWDELFDKGFPKPKFNVDQWMGSVFGGPNVRDDCNWDVKGTNAARDKQFGILFRLTPDGRLLMPMYYAPGAICSTAGKSVTLTFTYPVAAPGFKTKFIVERSTSATGQPIQPSGSEEEYLKDGSRIISDLSVVETDNAWKGTPNSTWRYLWFKSYNGYTEPTINDFKEMSWQLWKEYSKETITYWRSRGINRPTNPEEDAAEPAGQKEQINPNGDKFPYQGTSGESYTWDEFVEAVNNGDGALLNDITTDKDFPTTGQGWPYLWRKIESVSGNGSTTEQWDLVWEYTIDTDADGAHMYSKVITLNFYANMFKKGSGVLEPFWGKTFDTVNVKASVACTKDMIVMDLTIPMLGDGNNRKGTWKYFPGIPHAWNCSTNDRYAWKDYGSLGVGRNLLAKQNKAYSSSFNPGPSYHTYNYDSGQVTPKNLHEIFDKLVDGKEEWVKPHAPQQIFIPALKSGGSDIAGGDSEQQYGIWLGLADTDEADLVVTSAKRPVMTNSLEATGGSTTIEWYREKISLRFSWMKASENQPQTFKQGIYYKFSATKPAGSDFGTKLDDGAQLPEVSEDRPRLWVRYETSPNVFDEWFLYAEYQPDSEDPIVAEVATDLTWMSTSDPTVATLNNWLNASRCKELKDEILGIGVDQSRILNTSFGSATIICKASAPNTAIVSAIVTSYNTSANDKSHRSINFEYNISSKSITRLNGTYIIQKTFNPGYYYASDSTGTNARFIGTTNTGTVSETNKYILYTNDGKSWIIVDQYVAPDPNRYYFACASSSANGENTPYVYPGGFLAFAKSSSTDLVLFTGTSNYLPMDHGDDSDVTLDEMKTKVQNLITKCINAGARPGIVPKCDGLVQIWSFAASDKNTLDRTKFRRDKTTGSTGLSAADIYTGRMLLRPSLYALSRWVNESNTFWSPGKNAFGSEVVDWDLPQGWQTFDSVRLFICSTFKERLIDGNWGQAFLDRRNTVYSDRVGFAPGWVYSHIWNGSLFSIDGAWETEHVVPTTESGPGSVVGLRWGGPIQITGRNITVHGQLRCGLTGYDWPVGTNGLVGATFPPAGSQYNKLAAHFNIDNTGARIEYWIPYADKLYVHAEVRDIATGKSWRITCNGGRETFKVVESSAGPIYSS